MVPIFILLFNHMCSAGGAEVPFGDAVDFGKYGAAFAAVPVFVGVIVYVTVAGFAIFPFRVGVLNGFEGFKDFFDSHAFAALDAAV